MQETGHGFASQILHHRSTVAVSANTYTKFTDNDTSDSENSKFRDANDQGTFDVEDLVIGMIRFDNGAKPVFKPSQGVDMIKILCAIYESAEKGREVLL